MNRAMFSGVLASLLLTGSASFVNAEEYWAESPGYSSNACETYGECVEEQSFVHRLFNFRPWTAQSRCLQHGGAPGLPRGRRYFGGRYFGQFNNRFYGPQYGNF